MTVTTDRTPTRFREADCRVEDLVALTARRTDVADFPHAARVERDVLVYEATALRQALSEGAREDIQDELVDALTDGPGVVVLAGAFDDAAVLDRATAAYDAIIAEEKATGAGGNDHFGTGANDRLWNALEKLAMRDPETFVDYFSNDLLALVSEAWLGPAYQVTSHINVVRPGGVAQDPHRDYHLGFLSNEVAATYPAHVHLLSPVLTLQGAVAHSDMPVESGPTMYLPYSHRYAPGYLAWRLPEFRDHFRAHHVQLPLRRGDAVFFNPALLHGAGSNVSADVQRMANLLQVSSAFGRSMESVDRTRTTKAAYPVLRARRRAGNDPAALSRALACAAEGYPFPTNLDLDANIGGLTPPSQVELVEQALLEDWDVDRTHDALDAYDARHRTHAVD